MFYSMHVLTIIITCTFLPELEVQEKKIGSYTRNGVMEDSQGSYSHEEDIRGLHVSMGNVEKNSNGRRGRKEPVTMRNLHREVHSYKEDNERIVKSQGEILQSSNMLHRKVNKEYGSKQETSAIQVETSRSQSRRDDHENDTQSRRLSRCHHPPRKSIRINHESSRPGSIPSVSPVR
jgi:hypothetical protein